MSYLAAKCELTGELILIGLSINEHSTLYGLFCYLSPWRPQEYWQIASHIYDV